MARGEITHVEIPADDVERAKRFYEAVVGWEFSEAADYPDYHLFRTGERSGGAIGKRGVTVPDALRIYIDVDRLEDAIAAAQQHGGSIVSGPESVGDMGRYAVVRDPEGNEVALWESAPGR
jgi:predicted enzyme related to lactoylglutathione lyase